MEESERIQRIMEVEGATEPEARFLHHMDRAWYAWWEATEAQEKEEGEVDAAKASRFNHNFHNLQQMVYAEIHLREHSE